MASPQLGNVMQQYSCRCHNITIAAYDLDSTAKLATDYHRVFVGENGIHIVRHAISFPSPSLIYYLETPLPYSEDKRPRPGVASLSE